MGSLKNGLDCYVDLKEISREDDNPYYLVCEKIPIGVAVFDCKGNCPSKKMGMISGSVSRRFL